MPLGPRVRRMGGARLGDNNSGLHMGTSAALSRRRGVRYMPKNRHFVIVRTSEPSVRIL